MKLDAAPRWLTAIPLTYGENPGFWDRDAGLMCLGLRKLGVDCRFVALGEPQTRTDHPLILCRLDQMEDPAWWQQWRADCVFLTSWGAPQYEAVCRAIKQAGARLLVRLDSDGYKSPRVGFFRFLSHMRSRGIDQKMPFPALYAVVKTLVSRLVSSRLDEPICRHLAHADVIVIESPMARQILTRLLHELRRPELAEKIRVVPHPVKLYGPFDPAVTKRRQVVAVGRWDSHFKDSPRLMRVLGRALTQNPDYSAVLLGRGAEILETLRAALPPALHARLHIAGPVPHEALRQHYHESQIILFTSRSEALPVAAEEALCYGCSVVGPGTIPAFHFTASEASGSVSITRAASSLADALGLEMDAWRSGERDAGQISQRWRRRVADTAVAEALLRHAQ